MARVSLDMECRSSDAYRHYKDTASEFLTSLQDLSAWINAVDDCGAEDEERRGRKFRAYLDDIVAWKLVCLIQRNKFYGCVLHQSFELLNNNKCSFDGVSALGPCLASHESCYEMIRLANEHELARFLFVHSLGFQLVVALIEWSEWIHRLNSIASVSTDQPMSRAINSLSDAKSSSYLTGSQDCDIYHLDSLGQAQGRNNKEVVFRLVWQALTCGEAGRITEILNSCGEQWLESLIAGCMPPAHLDNAGAKAYDAVLMSIFTLIKPYCDQEKELLHDIFGRDYLASESAAWTLKCIFDPASEIAASNASIVEEFQLGNQHFGTLRKLAAEVCSKMRDLRRCLGVHEEAFYGFLNGDLKAMSPACRDSWSMQIWAAAISWQNKFLSDCRNTHCNPSPESTESFEKKGWQENIIGDVCNFFELQSFHPTGKAWETLMCLVMLALLQPSDVRLTKLLNFMSENASFDKFSLKFLSIYKQRLDRGRDQEDCNGAINDGWFKKCDEFLTASVQNDLYCQVLSLDQHMSLLSSISPPRKNDSIVDYIISFGICYIDTWSKSICSSNLSHDLIQSLFIAFGSETFKILHEVSLEIQRHIRDSEINFIHRISLSIYLSQLIATAYESIKKKFVEDPGIEESSESLANFVVSGAVHFEPNIRQHMQSTNALQSNSRASLICFIDISTLCVSMAVTSLSQILLECVEKLCKDIMNTGYMHGEYSADQTLLKTEEIALCMTINKWLAILVEQISSSLVEPSLHGIAQCLSKAYSMAKSYAVHEYIRDFLPRNVRLPLEAKKHLDDIFVLDPAVPFSLITMTTNAPNHQRNYAFDLIPFVKFFILDSTLKFYIAMTTFVSVLWTACLENGSNSFFNQKQKAQQTAQEVITTFSEMMSKKQIPLTDASLSSRRTPYIGSLLLHAARSHRSSVSHCLDEDFPMKEITLLLRVSFDFVLCQLRKTRANTLSVTFEKTLTFWALSAFREIFHEIERSAPYWRETDPEFIKDMKKNAVLVEKMLSRVASEP